MLSIRAEPSLSVVLMHCLLRGTGLPVQSSFVGDGESVLVNLASNCPAGVKSRALQLTCSQLLPEELQPTAPTQVSAWLLLLVIVLSDCKGLNQRLPRPFVGVSVVEARLPPPL